MFDGGLNAFNKPKDDGYRDNYTRIFGKGKYDDVEPSKDMFSCYRPKGEPTASRDKNLAIMRDNFAYRESEQGKRDFTQPFDEHGKVNGEFVKIYGEDALRNAERQRDNNYKTK